jgi:hypothetical protein
MSSPSNFRNFAKQAKERESLRPFVKKALKSEWLGDSDKGIDSLLDKVTEVQTYLEKLKDVTVTIKELVYHSDPVRIDRSLRVKVNDLQFDGSTLRANVDGETSGYKTRITLSPRRGFNCTCADRAERGRLVGPCKHVIATGQEFWKTLLLPEIQRLEEALEVLLESTELLQ